MMKEYCGRLRSRVAEEGGAALVVVLALSITMLILISAALSFSLSGMKVADKDADTTAALAAAYAGVDEYASRLSNDSRYQSFGNPDAPFTIATGSALSVTLPAPGQENPAFGVGESGPWAEIAGTDSRAAFRYEVDNSQYSSQGKLRVRSTGRVGDETQSVVADLRQSGFIDFLYYTKYEIMDPTISDTRCTPGYAYNSGGTVRHNSYCTEIQFGENDVLNGPVHSDDTMRICGSEFNGRLTSSSKLGLTNNYVKVGSCSTPDFMYGLGPAYAAEFGMPPTNDAMAKEARLDVPEVVRPGCMYTGPTTITFLANGTVNVVSPWTKYTNPTLTAGSAAANRAASENRPVCGNITALRSTAGATFTVPEQNLMWVQSVPTATTDPNYSGAASSAEPAGFDCTGSGDSVGWRYGTLRYPLSNERTADSSTSASPAYGCRNGDAYVKGVVHGQVSVASENFIYITGNLTYADNALDVLGLVGNNAVWVWNPINSSNGDAILADNRTIYAAILSVQHTFQVQNYDRGGDRGTLKVVGAIAQLFRGTVARGSDGYDKDYNYDDRLFSISPPKFLTPTSTTYGVTKYALVPTAFSASGASN